METVQTALWVVGLLVILALLFDFMNGFHDAANSIATVVSTGVLRPGQAVLFAAFFNFVAIFIFHLSVAATVGKGIVEPGIVDTHVVFGALLGAISWNYLDVIDCHGVFNGGRAIATDLGHRLLLHRHWCGDHVWRLANCENNGAKNHQVKAGGRFLC